MGEALREWLPGKEDVLAAAEGQAREFCKAWWAWLQAESSEALVSVRIDFLVRCSEQGLGEAWTCEVGEQGYSSVGWEDFPGIVFPEVFMDCLLDGDCEVEDCGCSAARDAAARGRLRRSSRASESSEQP